MDNSDKNRRTLSEALRARELPEGALAFVTGDGPPPGAVPAPVNTAAIPAPPPAPVSDPAPMANCASGVLPLTDLTRMPLPTTLTVLPAIASMTFRLPASLVAQLARVSAERKLRRDRPFHQQDIVAEALRQWLARAGIPD